MNKQLSGRHGAIQVMVDGVNQTTFQSMPDGLIFFRRSENDDPVDRMLLDSGNIDTFVFTSEDAAGFGVSISMSGTVRKLGQTRLVADRELGLLFWDWTYEVKSSQGSFSSRIKTTTEFDFTMDLWLGNCVEAIDEAGNLEITDDHSDNLLSLGAPGFHDAVSHCEPNCTAGLKLNGIEFSGLVHTTSAIYG